MNLPKYNLSYNTRDLLKKLALNVSKRKIDLHFPLWIGRTFANFNLSGKIPSEKEELAMSANSLEIVIRIILISFDGIS